MMTSKQIKRKEFAINNNLLELIGKTISEKEMIQILENMGIETFMCVDAKNEDDFFELTGLFIRGYHNDEVNNMEFKIFEI